jgi:hypothetical protein
MMRKLAVGLLLVIGMTEARADYPDKPVRIVVPVAPLEIAPVTHETP